MRKYIVLGLYMALLCCLACVQIIVLIFNPVFSLENKNIVLENAVYSAHGIVFIIFICSAVFFAKKLWSQRKR